MSKVYKNSPIIEAVCALSFDPNIPWEGTIPGALQAKLKKRFPKTKQLTNFQQVVAAGLNATQQPVFQQQFRQAYRTQFLSEDEKSLVQVEPHLLSINHLAPYPTWQEFSPLIKQGISAFRAVAPTQNLSIAQLAYQNQIVIPGNRLSLADWFNFYFVASQGIASEESGVSGFAVGVQAPYEAGRDVLKIQLNSADHLENNTSVFLLQISYEVVQEGQLALEQVSGWLTQAHRRIEAAFEGAIKDDLRALFGVENV